jgi:hypothetical protein
MRQFLAKQNLLGSIKHLIFMEPPALPSEKRTSFASPAMVYVIVGIIAATFVMFIVLHP